MASLEVSISKLNAALKRLIEGKPVRVKAKGLLTLNKINNEVGFGASYIHHAKFAAWVKQTGNPAIKKFAEEYDPLKFELANGKEDLTKVEVLKAKLKKEQQLKEKYRLERDEAISKEKLVKKLNNDLMFRVYELQEKVRMADVISINRSKS
jgi:cell shape-determining protein MreC